MVTIILIVIAVVLWAVAYFSESSRIGFYAGFYTLFAGVLYGIFGSILAFSGPGSSEDYTTTLNGTVYYCERPEIVQDSGWYWPGLQVTIPDGNDDNATCYEVSK